MCICAAETNTALKKEEEKRWVMSGSCDPMNCSLWGSSIHGILQARIMEWVAISFSRRTSQPRNWTQVSYIALLTELHGKSLKINYTPIILIGWNLILLNFIENQLTQIHFFFPFKFLPSVQFSSVAQLCLTLCDPMDCRGHDARLPCPSLTPKACPNSYPSSWWCHPTISSSVVPLSFHLQSFPASGSFSVSGGQRFGVSASTSVLPMNIQDWFPLGLTGLISLQSNGLSRVFPNTTVQNHQFFSAQLSL